MRSRQTAARRMSGRHSSDRPRTLETAADREEERRGGARDNQEERGEELVLLQRAARKVRTSRPRGARRVGVDQRP